MSPRYSQPAKAIWRTATGPTDNTSQWPIPPCRRIPTKSVTPQMARTTALTAISRRRCFFCSATLGADSRVGYVTPLDAVARFCGQVMPAKVESTKHENEIAYTASRMSSVEGRFRRWHRRKPTRTVSSSESLAQRCQYDTSARVHDGRVKLTLDLHDIYNRGADIDRALRAVMDEAVAKKAPLVEIIPGKGSGALKKRVLRFLDQKEKRALYHRVEKDVDNHGRIFVHFRWKGPARRR